MVRKPISYTLTLFMIVSIGIRGQNNTDIEMVQRVFKNIVNSIGNNHPSPPVIEISNSIRYVASVSDGIIKLEEKALTTLNKFEDPESAIAYVLSHELAHYYLNHSWMGNSGLSYSSNIGQFLDRKYYDEEQRKLEETQADFFGGFFSQISGYNSLGIGSRVLDSLYRSYEIPMNLSGYPSLKERKEIISSNLERVKKLGMIFEVGLLSTITGDYTKAEDCFLHILSENFTSREIYNNLGAIYIMKAIKASDASISRYVYPVFFEANSRASDEVLRDINDDFRQSNELIRLAKDNLERSISLDDTFSPALVNLLICRMLEAKMAGEYQGDSFSKDINKIKDIDEKGRADLLVLNAILSNGKKRKITKMINGGTSLSKINFDRYNSQNSFSADPNTEDREKYDKFDFDTLLLYGITKPYEYASSGKGVKVKKKFEDQDIVYEVNQTNYFIKIGNRDYTTSKDIRVEDASDKIRNAYGNPEKIQKMGQSLYWLYSNRRIIFETNNNQVKSIWLFI